MFSCLCQHWVMMGESWHLTVNCEPPGIPKRLQPPLPSGRGGCAPPAPGDLQVGLFWGPDWPAALEIYLWDPQNSPLCRTRGN